MLDTVNHYLDSRGIRITTGTIVDATIIHAPSSTKTIKKERDPEMHQTRKGNQWCFGAKAHIGMDSKSDRDLPLSQLNESKTNPRRVFDEASLKELAASIRSQGLLSPLLVRPLTENGFEIVAGARRYRAAQIAEAATVPVRIVHLSDAEVIEAQLVENLIRAELHPMEEAEGFARLLALEEPKYSIEQISARVGKQPSFVAARLKLIDLVPAVVEAFYANEIGVGHALLLAKLPADQQEQALRLASRKFTAPRTSPREFSCVCAICNSGLNRMCCLS